KISNYLNYFNSKFMEYFVPKNICVDELTVGFNGEISFITYSPKKPTKWNLRVYVLPDFKNSYVYSFVPYYGKLIHPEFQFTNRIVLQQYQNLLENIHEAKGYHIFTDRFYTSPALATSKFRTDCTKKKKKNAWDDNA
ncbi:unnamed protein product, partial [Heterotrigona itama]